jgi:two-component system nitrogen regulation response regulator NtrX
VGGTRVIETDVRVLAATNKDLEIEMEEGRFRQDLFYRLNVIPLEIPPLRDRKEDIPLLVARFIAEFCQKEGKDLKKILPDALEMLMEHNWPGNVRELKNIIERLIIMTSSDLIKSDDIPPMIRINPKPYSNSGISSDSFREARMEWEKNFIMRKLQENEGNVSRTADTIGLERSNLHRKIKGYGLDFKKE